MTDVVAPSVRSRMMSGIGPKDTAPELIVRRALFAAGFRYRLHRRDLPGRPDIVLARHRCVIFVHGCFWHAHRGCRYAKWPKSRAEFWREKLLANRRRDAKAVAELKRAGWRVLVVWECATRDPERWETKRRECFAWIKGSSRSGHSSTHEIA